MPLHVESDSCDRSGVEYYHAKNRLGKLHVFVFRCEGKILLTLFGDDDFRLATLKNISVASWRLPKKSNFGPCMMSFLKYHVVEMVSWVQFPPRSKDFSLLCVVP